jgi:aminodeoxyfutalosine synthase
MIGQQMSQLALSFGVDDLDGTINNSTQIYSLAGADDKNPAIPLDGLIKLIRDAGCTPVERDSWYNILKEF